MTESEYIIRNENGNVTAIREEWCAADIKSAGSSLTEEQVGEVLEYLYINHDASIGINWDVVHHAIGVITEKELNKKGE